MSRAGKRQAGDLPAQRQLNHLIRSPTLKQPPTLRREASPAMKVYIDNKLVFQSGGPEISLFEGGVANGPHHLVINAWDNFGRLYKAQENFQRHRQSFFRARPAPWGYAYALPARDKRSHRTWPSPPASKATPPSATCGPMLTTMSYLIFHLRFRSPNRSCFCRA